MDEMMTVWWCVKHKDKAIYWNPDRSKGITYGRVCDLRNYPRGEACDVVLMELVPVPMDYVYSPPTVRVTDG
jgi:hypothetical protein